MKRVYKVLLPLYREEEMSREVAQEWKYDARGQSTMNLTMFQKTLFRIAHGWATHIDMDEYNELLNKVYDRITVKKIIRGNTGTTEIALPRIQIEIFQEKDVGDDDDEEWSECDEDEDHDEKFEYMHKEDPLDPSSTKRYRKLIESDGGQRIDTKQPISYREEVQFFREPQAGNFDMAVKNPSERDIVVDLLAEMTDVYPMGYPTE